jgi:hypothetical protein
MDDMTEAQLRSYSYECLIGLLKRMNIPRASSDTKYTIIRKILSRAKYINKAAEIKAELKQQENAITGAKTLERIYDRLKELGLIVDKRIVYKRRRMGKVTVDHVTKVLAMPCDENDPPTLNGIKKFIKERVNANFKTALHHHRCMYLQETTGFVLASSIQSKQEDGPRRSLNTLLGHGKNGVGYIVLKIPIQIMNLCTSAVQRELKHLTSTKGEYLFMNADEGSTHPSGTRMMQEVDISLIDHHHLDDSSEARPRKRQKREQQELDVKNDIFKLIADLKLVENEKKNLIEFLRKLKDWLLNLDFIKERELKAENILLALIHSIGSDEKEDFYQGDHTDFHRAGINRRIKDEEWKDMPLGALLSIDSKTDTFLRIIPNSHKYNRSPNDHIFHQAEVIQLKRGEMIFFHGLLAHAGYGYEMNQNIRLHFYLLKENILSLITTGEKSSILGTFPFDECLRK